MSQPPASTQVYRPFSKAMRSGLIGPATRGLLGILLFVLATRTAKYFAWTIQPPLTAAFLGANYLASTALAILASREGLWSEGRISISVAFVFSPLVTAATFIHLNQFHTGSSGITLVITWFWLIAYGLYPIQLTLLMIKQMKIKGGDPPRLLRLPAWIKGILVGHAVILIPLGLLMFVLPSVARPLWPWPVESPLALRVMSAWVLSFGVLAIHQILEDDVDRVKVALLCYPILGVLHIVALARFGDTVQWHELGAWLYVAILASAFALGAFGWTASRRLPRVST